MFEAQRQGRLSFYMVRTVRYVWKITENFLSADHLTSP